MSTGEIAYLALVLVAFTAFAASLFIASWGRHDEPVGGPDQPAE
jgi:hypothetical protein